MTNIYWPVYRNLESEIDQLAFAIHIDDNQLNVYSSKIIDLILRAAVETESLSKELYKTHGGVRTGSYKFDDVAIKHLKNLWHLDKKNVLISSPHCFQTKRILTPFIKNEERTSSASGKQTYSWNNAYQNLKHDRAQSFTYGSLKYLFDIMAALYVLNIYYRNELIPLEKDSSGVNFPENLGSTLFSVQLAASPSHDGAGNYVKKDDFDEAIYYVNWTQETGNIFQESMNEFNAHYRTQVLQHPKILKYISENDISDYKGNFAWDVLGKDEYISLMQRSQAAIPIKGEQLKYEAVLNTHDF